MSNTSKVADTAVLHGDICKMLCVLRVAKSRPDFLGVIQWERCQKSIEAIELLREALEATEAYKFILRGREQFEQMRFDVQNSAAKQ